MTKPNNRTRPLDRDGDGRDGGSLPGNKTAPYGGAQVEGVFVDEAGDLPIAAPDAMAEVEPDLVEQAPIDAEDAVDQPDTFTAEEIAAGHTPVIEAEGEATALAADAAITIPADDPLIQIETETAPIAVRERELRLLLESRRLYKSAEGYSSNYGAPYIDETTVQGWIAAGLAEDVPSAGTWGGVKPTPEARRQLGLIVHGTAD